MRALEDVEKAPFIRWVVALRENPVPVRVWTGWGRCRVAAGLWAGRLRDATVWAGCP